MGLLPSNSCSDVSINAALLVDDAAKVNKVVYLFQHVALEHNGLCAGGTCF